MQRIFQHFTPSPLLQPYIDRYKVFEWRQIEGSPPLIKVLPHGHPEFVFHYGDPFLLYDHAGRLLPGSNLRALIGGQRKQCVFLQPSGTTGFFAIRFKPAGLHRLMGGNMAIFTESSSDLEEIYGPGIAPLVRTVLSATDTEKRIHVAEQFFRERLLGRAYPDTYAHHAVRFICDRGGQVKVTDLCRHLGIGERQVEREFLEKIGIAPKLFIRIIRLNGAFRLLWQYPELSWANLAYECGYVDQAHFINDFRAFSGETPRQYFQRHADLAALYQGY